MAESETTSAKADDGGRKIWIAIVVVIVLIAVAIGLFYFLRPTVVPDVELKSSNEAALLLDHVGLRVGKIGEVATDTVGVGLVIAQSPAGGKTAPRHSSVDVTIAVESIAVTMPDVTGLDIKAATEKLEAAQLIVRTVDVLETADKVGTVLGQAPAAGKEWKTGQPVALAIAAGPDDGTGTKVPDIYGDSFNTATDTLAEAGLLGYGLAVDPTAVNTSEVDQQLPEAGVMVRQGTTVLFLLGER